MNYTNTTKSINNYNEISTIFLLICILVIFISILSVSFPKTIIKLFCYNNKVSHQENLRYHNPHYSYFEIFFDNLNDDCSICLQKFCKNECIYVTDCNHYFHKDCIIKHFKNNYNCPLCRSFVYDTYDVKVI